MEGKQAKYIHVKVEEVPDEDILPLPAFLAERCDAYNSSDDGHDDFTRDKFSQGVL